MIDTTQPRILRTVLLVDAATCLISGGLMALGSGPVAALTGISASLLFTAGLSLFPIAAFMAVVATRRTLFAPAVWLIVVGNALWVAGSLWLLAGGAPAMNAIGAIYVAAQAAVVAVLTWLEARGAAALATRAANDLRTSDGRTS